MTSYRLFPTTNGPATAASYAGNFISGVLFAVSGGGNWFEGYWYWVASNGVTGPVKCALWSAGPNSTGSVVPGSVVTSGTLTTGAWNYIPLSTPVQLAPSYDPNYSTAGSVYIAAIGVNGNFSDTTSQFNSGDVYAAGITNGSLVAYSGTTGSKPAPYGYAQGVFTTTGSDPSLVMPTSGDSGGDGASNFWIDVQISDTAPSGYSGSYRVWPNKFDTNPVTTTDAAVNYVIATEFKLTGPATLDKIWYYSPSGTAQLATWAGIYQITGADSGTLVASNASPTWSGAAASGWVSTSFTGVTLPAGDYKVAVYNDAATPDAWGPKDANSAYFDLGVGANGIVNGPISVPNLISGSPAYVYNATGNTTFPPTGTQQAHAQPTFAQPMTGITLPAYPYLWAGVTADTDSVNSTHSQNYWVDVEVTPVSFNISVLDYAGAVDLVSIPSVSLSLSDTAASLDALTVTVSVPVADVAASQDTLSVLATIQVADIAGAIDVLYHSNAGTNLTLPAIVLMAAAYTGS